MRAHLAILILAATTLLTGASPHVSNIPPFPGTDVPLSDGKFMHVRELPLARMDGVVRDGARFDRSGTRIALLATFPLGAVDTDWRRMGPTQAYVADLARRSLVAITADGQATSIIWRDANHVAVSDAGTTRTFEVLPAAKLPSTAGVLQKVTPSTSGTLVSPPEEFRLQAYKTSAGSYAIGQVGAVRLRTIAVAPDGRRALVGGSVVWIDNTKNGGPPIARDGPDTVAPPSFPRTPYGDALTPVYPLGHAVFQGAYRNGTAYFAFSYGLARIVAATSDFATYAYPALPKQPDFSVGDAFGAGGDSTLYFADPENGVVQFWQNDRYVEKPMQFPAGNGGMQQLLEAMLQLGPGDRFVPPLRPDADALDNALLEWRIYPVGDVTGPRWIASFLGRAYIAGAGKGLDFTEIHEPGFPFAVLGRTDDGRLWGAMPAGRTVRGSAVVSTVSQLMYSRDGTHWMLAASLNGDPGAVGMHGGVPWVAMTAFEGDASGVEVVRIEGRFITPASTGAIYGGEDMFFADTASGFYLVCGGAPGSRKDDGSGPLVALRLDTDRLFALDGDGRNEYLRDRLNPLSAGAAEATTPFTAASTSALEALAAPYVGTLVSDALEAPGARIRPMTFDAERQFEIEYAWKPFPLATVNVAAEENGATVRRTLQRGVLAADGQTERWSRDADGRWRLVRVESRWRY